MSRYDSQHANPDGAGGEGHPHLLTDGRLVPIAAGVWVGAWCGTGGGQWAWVAAALVACLGVVGWRRRSWLAAGAAIVLAGAAVMGGARAWIVQTSPIAQLASRGAAAHIEAVVVGEPREMDTQWGTTWSARVRVVSVHSDGRQWAQSAIVLVYASGERWSALEVGSRFTTTVKLSEFEPRAAIAAVAQARAAPSVRGRPSMPLRAVERVRAGLRASAQGLDPDARALVPALVVGDTRGIDDDLAADFAATGLTHLTAVSGANLTFLLAFVGVASRWLGVRGWWLRAVSVVGIVAFVALCRAEPSVVRAAAMGSVALASLGRRHSRAGPRLLAVAVIVLVIGDPWMSRSWGFGLSVAATAGIVGLAGHWAERFGAWMFRPLAEAIGVTLAAQLATLPLVAALSGQVSVVSLVANVIAGPLVGPATVLGFVAAGLSVASPGLAAILAWAAGWFAIAIAHVARVLAGLPGADLAWPSDPLSLTVLTAACVAIAVIITRVAGSVWGCGLLAIGLAATAVLGPPRLGWPPGDWRIAVCDVGQGDAFLIRAGPRAAVMVDTGPDPRLASRCLQSLRVSSIPLVVLTHDHADHVGGLAGVAQRVDMALVNAASADLDSGQAVADVLSAAEAERRMASSGDVLQVGEATVRVLEAPSAAVTKPMGGDEGESSEENDASLAVVVEHVEQGESLAALFVGDREPSGQARLVAAGVPDVDVLAVPHHGSGRQDEEFLQAAHARVALVSCGADNPYGHPADKTLSMLQRAGARVYRTDTVGTFALSGTADNLVVTASPP